MAWYVVRQPDARYAIFDDMLVSFVLFDLSISRAAIEFMNRWKTTPTAAFEAATHAKRDLRLGEREHGRMGPHARLNEILTAIRLIRGEDGLTEELSALGAPSYQLPDISDGYSEDFAEICDIFFRPVPMAFKFLADNQPWTAQVS